LIAEKGMGLVLRELLDHRAARRAPRWFKPFVDASKPVFEKLWQSVRDASEASADGLRATPTCTDSLL